MSLGRFRFGLFEFDVATRELRREGALLRLQSQPARVLCCLIEHAGKVVSREELRRAVWGGETFVDFDRGLNFCIGQIRSALCDDSTTPRYVRTLPKRGYQFIAPVEPIGERIDENVGARLEPIEIVSTKRRFTLTTAALMECDGAWIMFQTNASAHACTFAQRRFLVCRRGGLGMAD